MRDGLLILWVALLMASRMDFLGGSGPLQLPPFLILSPLILGIEGMRAWTRDSEVRIPRGASAFLLAVTALLVILLASTFLSYEVGAAARRLALLVVQVFMVFLIGIVLANHARAEGILLRGAVVGLWTILAFNLVQTYVFLVDPGWIAGIDRIVDLDPGNYAGVIPRLTGVSHDPNHGGLFTVFLLWLVARLAPPSRTKTTLIALGAISVVLTLSRSAMLTGLVLWGATILERRRIRVGVPAIGVAAGLTAMIVLLYLAVPALSEAAGGLADLLGGRLTLDEGSSSQHAVLMFRAWEVGTDNLRHLFLGIGYGNAFVVTQDIFPGNEYGNFHSLFLTLFAEAGVLAAGLGVWIFAHALRSGGEVRPMVAALLAFNLFQQAHTEPLFWLCLMMAWAPFGTTFSASAARQSPA